MKLNTIFVALAVTFLAGTAFAQATSGAQRCQALAQDVQSTYQKAVQARVPKQDPSSYTQESQDIKGLMSIDAAGGLSKLMNLDFSGIMNKLVDQAMTTAANKGQATFNNKMNGILNDVGVKGMNFQGSVTNSGVSGLAPAISGNVLSSTVSGKVGQLNSSVYSRPNTGK
ncbi:hypothetical protein [Paucibacter soli]|uniref:hypothetical protein n=1 Tax=Paucibacter soli TaxID=3133433 RepID=UPI0030AB3AE5